MFGLNKVYLVGYLGSDPQVVQSKGGKDYTRLNLATHRPIKNPDGQWDSITDWHSINVWGKKGETCSKHLKKGAKIMIDGSLSHYEIETTDGETRRHTSITANNIEFFNAAQT